MKDFCSKDYETMSDETANGAMPAAALKRFADDLKTNETEYGSSRRILSAWTLSSTNNTVAELDPRVEDHCRKYRYS